MKRPKYPFGLVKPSQNRFGPVNRPNHLSLSPLALDPLLAMRRRHPRFRPLPAGSGAAAPRRFSVHLFSAAMVPIRHQAPPIELARGTLAGWLELAGAIHRRRASCRPRSPPRASAQPSSQPCLLLDAGGMAP